MSRPNGISARVIVLGVAASLAAPCARAQCLQSDDFSGQTYGPQWSQFLQQNTSPLPYIANLPVPWTNPMPGRYLVLGASPYGVASDLWPDAPGSNYLASVLLQPVNPNADWTITTETAAYVPPVYKASAGLVLATRLPPFPSGNQMWRVAEYGSAPPVDGQPGGNQVTGLYYPTGTLVNNSPYEYPVAYTSSVVYLRVTKSGINYSVSYSSDNVIWTHLYSDTVTQPFTFVGFSSTDYPVPANEFGPYNMPYFHYFDVTNQTG